jgi:hypothetical protein
MKVYKQTSKTTTQRRSEQSFKQTLNKLGWKLPLRVLLSLGAFLSVFLDVTPSIATPRQTRLYSVEGGPVYLQRPNWSDFYVTYPRTMLNSEDLLDVPVGAQVVLLCTDGIQRDWVGAGIGAVGTVCPGSPRIYRPSFGISEQWGADDPTEPYLITPRTGQVLTSTPTFYWHAVAGAQQYKVTLQQREGEAWVNLWTTTSSQASLCYPSSQPELEPGHEYTLQVSVAGQPERTEALPEPPIFSLVAGEERQGLEDAITAIETLDIDPAAKTLILVEEIYPQHKLFGQGINDLKALIDSGYETAQVYRLLGDYAIRTGLELPAEESYLQAIQLAAATDTTEEEALAAWGLGTMYARVGKIEPARTYLQKAEQIATEIGDADLIANISSELDKLQRNE